MAYCPECGTLLQIDDCFCGECGVTVQSQENNRMKNILGQENLKKNGNKSMDSSGSGPQGFFQSHKIAIFFISTALISALIGVIGILVYSKIQAEQKREEQKVLNNDGYQQAPISDHSVGLEKTAQRIEMPVNIELAPFTLNLQPENGDQYLQVSISLNIKDQAHADNVQRGIPGIRNKLLLILTSKKASEISTSEGKLMLSKEIVDDLNGGRDKGGNDLGILDVFFTSFVIQ